MNHASGSTMAWLAIMRTSALAALVVSLVVKATVPNYTSTAAFDSVEAVSRQAATATALGMPIVDTIMLPGGVPLEMVIVPAGWFLMGSPVTEDGHEYDETLHRWVIPQPFYISKYAVTQAQYQAVVGSLPPGTSTYRPAYTARVATTGDAFVPAAQQYAPSGWRFDMVTQAQMEYATRAGTHSKWSTGEDSTVFSTAAWHSANSGGVEHPVGQKIPNHWGLYDMLGNVWTWISHYMAQGYTETGMTGVVKSGDYQSSAGGNGCRSANHMVQTIPSALRLVMNCTTNLMTSVAPVQAKTVSRCGGISIAGDRIVINQSSGPVGLIEVISLDGHTMPVVVDAGWQQVRILRFKDLGLTHGTYLVRVRSGGKSVTARMHIR